MIKIVNEDFSLDELYSNIKSDKNGAISIFLGTVRDDLFNKDKTIEAIFLECYEGLAIKQLEEIKNEAIIKWNLNKCVIVHRIGKIPLGDKIVFIMTSSPHREESIRSNEFIIDQLKIKAAFWKFEYYGNDSKIIKTKEKDLKKNLKWESVIKS
jgi:molybdopterin synthase catalytic subunit|tara:strand:- start:66 stop:527 length:462 start_codon:yes stop_codon:yes gene_type:complete